MDLRLMGNVEICDGTRPISLVRAGERCVLASLALEPGRRLNVDTLIDRLWGDEPPAGAGPTIASYVRTVRKAIEDAGGRREWLRNHRPAHYELAADPGLIDYHRFTGLAVRARARQRDGHPADAIALYQQALTLRTAEPLGGVTGRWAADRRYTIELEYLDVVHALYDQQLAVGEYAAVAAHATQLVMDVVPTDRMIAQAVHGLARSGQHAAISGFLDRASKRMWDTAGAEPGREVVILARQLMANPNARLPELPDTPTGTHGHQHVDLLDGPAPSADGTRSSGSVIMTAEHNQQVFQAAGDQYITGG